MLQCQLASGSAQQSEHIVCGWLATSQQQLLERTATASYRRTDCCSLSETLTRCNVYGPSILLFSMLLLTTCLSVPAACTTASGRAAHAAGLLLAALPHQQDQGSSGGRQQPGSRCTTARRAGRADWGVGAAQHMCSFCHCKPWGFVCRWLWFCLWMLLVFFVLTLADQCVVHCWGAPLCSTSVCARHYLHSLG